MQRDAALDTAHHEILQLQVRKCATNHHKLVEIVQKITATNLEPEYKTPAGKIRAAVSTRLDFSIEMIDRMIGWKPQISFEAGIRRMIKWREAERGKAA